MKYRFYHEWLYQIAKFVAQKCNSIATRCVSIMRKMADRENAWLDKLKNEGAKHGRTTCWTKNKR